MGVARPVKVGRHVHPQATRANPEPTAAATPSGIDYLALVEQRLATQTRRTIAYAELPLPGLDDPNQQPHHDPGPPATGPHRQGAP
jgi:hypothetical protein